MFAKSTIVSLVSLLAVAFPAVDAYATVGCYPAGDVSTIVGGLLTVTSFNIASPAACAAEAVEADRAFAYYDGNLQICYSTNLEPLLGTTVDTVSTIVGGVGPSVCTPGQLQGLSVQTPYTDFGCALPENTVTTNAVIGLTNVLSIDSCLDVCQANGYRFAFVTNAVVSVCQCSTQVTITAPSVCGLLRNYVYVNNAIAPTGVARRRLAEQAKRAERIGACPTGLQACRVNQGEFASDDFECIDTQAELESCGGCTTGILDGDAELATSGVDCTALPGVEMGAVSCMSGKCQISKCKRGYTLIDNTCSSTRSVAALALNALRLQNL